jgi:hypothetical protein
MEKQVGERDTSTYGVNSQRNPKADYTHVMPAPERRQA